MILNNSTTTSQQHQLIHKCGNSAKAPTKQTNPDNDIKQERKQSNETLFFLTTFSSNKNKDIRYENRKSMKIWLNQRKRKMGSLIMIQTCKKKK